MRKSKFNIGDIVFAKVARRGSSEPSVCSVGEKLTVEGIRRRNNGNGYEYEYTCGYDGYKFSEDELMSLKEYKKSLK